MDKISFDKQRYYISENISDKKVLKENNIKPTELTFIYYSIINNCFKKNKWTGCCNFKCIQSLLKTSFIADEQRFCINEKSYRLSIQILLENNFIDIYKEPSPFNHQQRIFAPGRNSLHIDEWKTEEMEDYYEQRFNSKKIDNPKSVLETKPIITKEILKKYTKNNIFDYETMFAEEN